MFLNTSVFEPGYLKLMSLQSSSIFLDIQSDSRQARVKNASIKSYIRIAGISQLERPWKDQCRMKNVEVRVQRFPVLGSKVRGFRGSEVQGFGISPFGLRPHKQGSGFRGLSV